MPPPHAPRRPPGPDEEDGEEPEFLSTTPLGVRIPVFEGPLDLLLYLIRRDQLDIYDIPLGHITAQYLEMLGVMQVLDLEVAGEFLVMAATLMRVKARMLLPTWPEGEEDEEDPAGGAGAPASRVPAVSRGCAPSEGTRGGTPPLVRTRFHPRLRGGAFRGAGAGIALRSHRGDEGRMCWPGPGEQFFYEVTLEDVAVRGEDPARAG